MRAPDDILQSPRLLLRRFRDDAAHFEHYAALYADPEVAVHVGGVQSREVAQRTYAERVLDYYPRHPGLGIWATFERHTGAFAGLHLLNHIRGEDHIQVGYTLRRAMWGRGYATEMARVVMRHGFRTLGLPAIHGIVNLDNLVSQRVLLKLGMRREGERTFAQYGPKPLAWFACTPRELRGEDDGAG
ncbi:MAG: GNAT family N-acetyltransferase [Pseudomonadota bacterium]|jgi:ribosomal-protein-alanine N-acetyltransferase